MKRKILITILSVGALAIASVFGVFAYRSANAAAPIAVMPSNQSVSLDNFGKGFGGGYTSQDLATALGITLDQLNTAVQNADNAALDQAVKAGLITQAQADQLRNNGKPFPFDGRWGGWLSQSGIDYDTLLANALGITTDKLQAAYIQAYNVRIDQAVTNGNLTQAQADLMKGEFALTSNKNFQSAMQSAYQAAVKQAVTDGVITQAQADAILKNGNNLGFPGMGMPGIQGFNGFVGPRGFDHRGWGGGNAPANPNTPANPTVPQSPTATPSGGA
jgi:hypothetical protein